jgi:hypothetical protein
MQMEAFTVHGGGFCPGLTGGCLPAEVFGRVIHADAFRAAR